VSKKILVEGWRGINHSYAMVNQYQLLELHKMKFDLYHKDESFFRDYWNAENNPTGFSIQASNIISSIPKFQSLEAPDVTYRISYPYRLHPLNGGKLFVYGTSEYQTISKDMIFMDHKFGDGKNFEGTIITPSSWSKQGFVNSGFKDEQVKVVPHGVDLEIFKPLDDEMRNKNRELLGIESHHFVILSVGAMGHNKGVDILLAAYIKLKDKYPQIKLVLKDQNSLYHFSANDMFNQYCKKNSIDISDMRKNSFISDIITISGNLSVEDLNRLYGAADCYASPYRAEGFNLPPLEAAAAGVPIVVTDGGSTDDYVHESFALKIESRKISAHEGYMLEPNLDDLIRALTEVIESEKIAFNKVKARRFIENKFSWNRVTQDLVSEFQLSP
jgi:glycosyltransferase involved in cell wall biosynthesis